MQNPEIKHERHDRHESADAKPRRIEFGNHAGQPQKQQDAQHAGRRQGANQKVGPAGLDQRHVVLQVVEPLEFVEVVDRVPNQSIFLGPRTGKKPRPAARPNQFALRPGGDVRPRRNFLRRDVFFQSMVALSIAVDFEVRIDQRHGDRPGNMLLRRNIAYGLDDHRNFVFRNVGIARAAQTGIRTGHDLIACHGNHCRIAASFLGNVGHGAYFGRVQAGQIAGEALAVGRREPPALSIQRQMKFAS